MKDILQDKFGQGLNIKESPKTESEREEALFIDTIETLEFIYDEDHKLNEVYGIDLLGHSQYYYHIIENLIVSKYGYDKADIIWWWILDRFAEDGELLGVATENEDVYILKTPLDLWKFLQKI
jgi:hypothetical protein|tara:strand:- start:281 stop:649 length:369 start_codon:yes stop_codon:yes gene_type:complete